MTSEQIGAYARTLTQLVAGIAITKGVLDEQTWLAIGAAVAAVASFAWSAMWINKKTK